MSEILSRNLQVVQEQCLVIIMVLLHILMKESREIGSLI